MVFLSNIFILAKALSDLLHFRQIFSENPEGLLENLLDLKSPLFSPLSQIFLDLSKNFSMTKNSKPTIFLETAF